jgi:hypothetical protein
MPILIKDIKGEIITTTNGVINYYSSVVGQIQQEDYVNLNGFVAYLQNLTRAEVTVALEKPLKFGLVNQNNLPIETLLINY